MVSKQITIYAANGMHARPATALIGLAKGFPGCKISLRTPVRQVELTSILGILSLGLKYGTTVELIADGVDEVNAMETIADFISSSDNL